MSDPMVIVVVVEHRDRSDGVAPLEAAPLGRRLAVLDETETTEDPVRESTEAHTGEVVG